MASNVYDYRPANEVQLSDPFLSQHADEVLLYLLEIGVSYTSEISRNCQVHIESVNKILFYWKKQGFIDRIMPERYFPQPVFISRMEEFWAIGLSSYDKVISCNWWSPSPSAIFYIQSKFKGENKQIRSALFRQFQEQFCDKYVKN